MKRLLCGAVTVIVIMLFGFSLMGCGNPDQVTFHAINPSPATQENMEDNITQSDSTDIITDVIDDTEEMAAIAFEEMSEIVYTTTNVNIRSTYTTEVDNIVSVLHKGTSIERIGIHEDWSKVLYQDEIRYIKTEYLVTQKPVIDEMLPEENDVSEENITKVPEEVVTEVPEGSQNKDSDVNSPDEINVRDLKISSEINQLVCVIGNGGPDCTVSYHKKGEDGNWQQVFNIDGDCGSEGITYDKSEGDKKTPAGLYTFTLAFGIQQDPGAVLPYRRITEYDYWVDDMDNPYYNTWVNSQENPGDYNSEHLIDHNPSYNYALNINYNPECTPGLGSAMFLHCYNGTGRTTGCIAISEDHMKTLIQGVNRTAVILIVPSSAELANY